MEFPTRGEIIMFCEKCSFCLFWTTIACLPANLAFKRMNGEWMKNSNNHNKWMAFMDFQFQNWYSSIYELFIVHCSSIPSKACIMNMRNMLILALIIIPNAISIIIILNSNFPLPKMDKSKPKFFVDARICRDLNAFTYWDLFLNNKI